MLDPYPDPGSEMNPDPKHCSQVGTYGSLLATYVYVCAECANEEGISTSVGSSSTPLPHPSAEVSYVAGPDPVGSRNFFQSPI